MKNESPDRIGKKLFKTANLEDLISHEAKDNSNFKRRNLMDYPGYNQR